MNDINLCELLKGCEGDIFYSPAFGYVTLVHVNDEILELVAEKDERVIQLDSDGCFAMDGECVIFPSYDERDWSKFNKEKTPKIWDSVDENAKIKAFNLYNVLKDDKNNRLNDADKSVLAAFKINYLINVGYGGTVNNKDKVDCTSQYYMIYVKRRPEEWLQGYTLKIAQLGENIVDNLILFKSYKDATDFISHTENIELLKDYFGVDNIVYFNK